MKGVEIDFIQGNKEKFPFKLLKCTKVKTTLVFYSVESILKKGIESTIVYN